MKEDLAEWFQTLYPHLKINVDNFMDRLETGVALCEVRGKKLANFNLPNKTINIRFQTCSSVINLIDYIHFLILSSDSAVVVIENRK